MSESPTSVELEPLEQLHVAMIERVANDELELPLLPHVATEVLNLTSDPDADMTRLATLIQQDQAIASQVLKISNSAAYAPRSPIVSMQQAVSWLGMKMLGELALTVSIGSGVFRVKGYETEIGSLWRHALASGLFAKEIARLGRSNVECAFLCGLLHTIGKPVVLQAILEVQESMDLTFAWSDFVRILDVHHVQVGSLVVEKWKLPSHVKEAILYYGDYTQAPKLSSVAMATCLADRLASRFLGLDGEDAVELESLPVVEALNLYPEDMEALYGQGETVLQAVEAIVV
ncbi:HDOD domain-containing protein [Candidatus Nitronereus thalassa]|uniref:HDOD domain-containing protein n=1 Tax=Candidatus Nitronereus thalassa TaxID=3020898 RepID=A0ABU3K9C5_9BACT|nr:HDOD domain-containing protein [Candidatus Nitronereus thalassa]MDT7042990.1 HDOD domain-containing protein [Candidatus Nitronereus thalassa]